MLVSPGQGLALCIARELNGKQRRRDALLASGPCALESLALGYQPVG